MRKVYKVIIAFLIVCATLIVTLSSIPKESKPVLYFSETCPNCKIVEQYMNENKIDWITRKDIAQEKNRNALLNEVQKCGIQNAGVPLLTYNNRCYIGYNEVIDFLSQNKQ